MRLFREIEQKILNKQKDTKNMDFMLDTSFCVEIHTILMHFNVFSKT